MRQVKILVAFIALGSMFLVQSTSVAERPITLTRVYDPAPTTTVYEYGPNPIRQYFSGPDLPEWIEERYEAVIVSAPSEIEAAICSYSWPCDEAKKIAFCESSNRVDIISKPNSNGTRDFGLFQINSGAWGPEAFGERWDQVLELETNVELAFHIWTIYQWSPWVCSKVLGAS